MPEYIITLISKRLITILYQLWAVKEKAVRTATAEWAEWAAIMMRAKKVSMVEVVRSELTWVLPQSIYKPENFINLTVKFP